ncbi:MAG: 4Fe-4S binding protein [Phycisphaerae bacterium]|nr:4Fe-4S binding protein [Phycisphaerae bacterium]
MWPNMLRITSVRIVVQTVMFGLFLAFVFLTTCARLDRHPGLQYWVSKVLEIDPLVALATAVTTHTVYKGLLWSLIILIPTLFLGRFFCNWICPYGTLHQFTGWLFRRRKQPAAEANRYHRSQHVKYYILTAMLVAAALGSLQIGLLDPICLLYRSFTGAVVPALSMPAPSLLGEPRFHQGAWLIGFLLFGLVAMNLVIPRFFCRVLCPLGALLGVLSRFAWWRIQRDPDKCQDCGRCRLHCEAACDPHARLRKAECFVCFNCLEDCPAGALSFALFPPRKHEVSGPNVSRRKAIFAAVTGLLFYPFVRTAGRNTRDFSSKVIRPPGAVEELEFLERCLKCDQCIRVCPTNVIQPAWFESGLEGLWTPILNFRLGHCQLHCTACGVVCPSGAIQRISIARKLGLGEFAAEGPLRLGTAHVDVSRCLPYSQDVPCVVCEEVCPTSPKAIFGEYQMRMVRDGRKMVVSATENTVTVSTWPEVGQAVGEPAQFERGQWKGDETTRYHLRVRHADGMTETHRIADSDADTLTIADRFARQPEPGAAASLLLELKVPRVDADLCIGCGICELECPVVGDRRAIYVTAEGETRSEHSPRRDRNRSVRLKTTAAAKSGNPR